MDCFIGVDLGGTNVRAQARTSDGKPAGERYEASSHAQAGVEEVVEAIRDVAQRAQQSADGPVVRIGMAVPGHIDDAAGLVRWCPNFGKLVDGVFHYWENVPLKSGVEHATCLPVTMGNDANAAALGEYMFGVGKNSASCLVMLTLGTGIGGGVVMSPKSVQGSATGPLLLLGGNLGGGELGHTLVQFGGLDCNAGSYGSVEAYCQKQAIITRATHRLRRGVKSLIGDLVQGDLAAVTPATISEAASQGDNLALQVWREFGAFLGASVGSMVNIFAPDVFAFGGQVSKAWPYFIESLTTEARNVAIPSLFADCTIVQAEHEEDAGILGGAALAVQAHAARQ